MATLTGTATIFGETVTVTLELPDDKATFWLEKHIEAKGYNMDSNGDPVPVKVMATYALADAGKMWRETAQQKVTADERKAARLAAQAARDDTVWESGIVLP